MKKPRYEVSPPKSENRRVLQEISANTLHHHMSMKAQKMVSKRLNMYEEHKDDQKPTLWNNGVAKGLIFDDHDIDMEADPITSLCTLPYELQGFMLLYLPI